jgi:hypothetical protein
MVSEQRIASVFRVCLPPVSCLIFDPEDGGGMFSETLNSFLTVRRYSPENRTLKLYNSFALCFHWNLFSLRTDLS